MKTPKEWAAECRTQIDRTAATRTGAFEVVEVIVAEAVREAEEAVRRKGFGPGLTAITTGARSVAEVIVAFHAPDFTGMEMVTITADAIARFAATEAESAILRCATAALKVADALGASCRDSILLNDPGAALIASVKQEGANLVVKDLATVV